ncbi:hypothetical protein BDZ45DRAFT_680205 [Acephala macrosclerotiorum]|nr:hypothetical protein BDZ45DRAFT_680205 [Acephala macrosclerotiorum]
MSNDRPKDLRLGNVAPSNINNTQNAALRGASLAFGKPPAKPKPKINDYAGSNGALAAAKAGAGRAASRNVMGLSSGWEEPDNDERLAYQNTGSSVGGRSYTGGPERPSVQQRLSQFGGGGGGGYLQPPGGTPDQNRSASFIAATLAASRSASVSPNPTGQSQVSHADLRRPAGFMARSPSVRSTASSRSSDPALDITPIPHTTSLIGMFEQNAGSPKTVKRPPVKRSATSASVNRLPASQNAASPKASRPQSPSPLSAGPETSSDTPPKLSLAQIQRLSEESEAKRPPPPAPNPSILASKPILIPAKRKPKLPSPEVEKEEDASSDDSFVSASEDNYEYKPSFRAELAQQRRLTSTSTHSVDTQATIDSMANAIVASSLASSRAVSPSKSSLQSTLYPPPPPPRRNARQHHLFHTEKSRTPSPAKPVGLRMTMRKPKSKDSLDEGEKRRGKKNLVKKHPNKHHEGDRKRWRDSITERERKRYEAVWASNKGLYSNKSPGSEYCVCNLVVRDIFSRSRLSADVLEEVYALVDRSENGMLEKEEFVVGLWLIDQRLKGRKLPIRVSDHVWKSVGTLAGIKVKKAK